MHLAPGMESQRSTVFSRPDNRAGIKPYGPEGQGDPEPQPRRLRLPWQGVYCSNSAGGVTTGDGSAREEDIHAGLPDGAPKNLEP